MEHPLVYVVDKYLDKLGVNVNREEIKLQLLSHPGFPNIISISDLFHHFELDHYALKVSSTKDSLEQLPKHFLAHCDAEDDPKLLLVEKKNTELKVYWKKGATRIIPVKEFLNSWSGIMIVLEESSTQKSKNTRISSLTLKLLFGLFVLSISGVLILNTFETLDYLMIVSSIAGITISIYIIQHELGKNLKALNKFCKTFENTSCDDVINSEGASLFGIFKLSDLAIVYFSSQLLFIVFNSLFKIDNHLIFNSLSALSIPMILYSLYYQGIIVKKWCPLCLGLVAVLSFQSIVTFGLSESIFNSYSSSTYLSILLFTLIFSLIGLIWIYFSPLFSKEIKLDAVNVKYLKFKRNYPFFKQVLSSMTTTSKYYGSKGEISFGNIKADLKIIFITNPTCHYCIEAHNIMEKLLSLHGEDICFRIRFNLMNLNIEKVNAKAAHYFLETFNDKGAEACRSVMHHFYNQSDKEDWIKQKELNLNPEYIQILEMHKSWCKENGINFTPSLVIDNQLYPKKYYAIEDVSYFIEDLIKAKSKRKKSYIE